MTMGITDRIRNLGIEPAPISKFCYSCEMHIELSQWYSHEVSERHERLSAVVGDGRFSDGPWWKRSKYDRLGNFGIIAVHR